MKIAVVGSRNFKHEEFVLNEVHKSFTRATTHDDWLGHDVTFVSGGASGVDTWAEEEVKRINETLKSPIKIQIFYPDWAKYGQSAGFIRNEDIIKSADIVLAFWDGTSKGTKSSIDLAIKHKKAMDIYVR